MKLVLWRHWCIYLRRIQWPQRTNFTAPGCSFKVSSDTILGQGATLIFKVFKMKLFRASRRSVVHIAAGLTSNESPVWPAEIFQTFMNTVVCKRCLSQSFRHQSTSSAKNHTVKSCIKAAAYVQFFNFLVRLLFKYALYAKSWVCKTRKSGLAHVKWKWNWHGDCSKSIPNVNKHLACEKWWN